MSSSWIRGFVRGSRKRFDSGGGIPLWAGGVPHPFEDEYAAFQAKAHWCRADRRRFCPASHRHRVSGQSGRGHRQGRLPEIRHAHSREGQGQPGEGARAARLQGRVDRVPGRPAASRSAECRRHRLSATPARRRRSSRRPPAHRSSMSHTSRRRLAARRSWCRKTARSNRSPISRARTVALNKGSNVHYLLVKALEEAGLQYSDIKTAFLPPADARAAFEKGAVDAWVIWDPFQAAAEAATGARTLRNGEGIVVEPPVLFLPQGLLPKPIRRSSTPS